MVMAQVYAMGAPVGVKLGWTTNLQRRYREISRGVPGGVSLWAVTEPMELAAAGELETAMHDRFAEQKLHHEWYAVDESDVLKGFVALKATLTEPPVLTLTDGPKRYPDKQVASFEAGTFIQLDDLRQDRSLGRTDVYREAVQLWIERELKRRERQK